MLRIGLGLLLAVGICSVGGALVFGFTILWDKLFPPQVGIFPEGFLEKMDPKDFNALIQNENVWKNTR